ncbi:hypothetical protein J7K86_02510 [bacterium]|nr:hypothetical protein [bacterium]
MRALIIVLGMLIVAFVFLSQALFILLSPGIRFQTPEEAVENYWSAMNENNRIKAAISFNDVFFIATYYVAKQTEPLSTKVSEPYFIKKTVLNDTLIHLQYQLELKNKKNKKFISGDLMVYTERYGWRILRPMINPPK